MFTHTYIHMSMFVNTQINIVTHTHIHTVTHTSPNDGYRSFLKFSVTNFAAILILYFDPDSQGMYHKTLKWMSETTDGILNPI